MSYRNSKCAQQSTHKRMVQMSLLLLLFRKVKLWSRTTHKSIQIIHQNRKTDSVLRINARLFPFALNFIDSITNSKERLILHLVYIF